MKYRIGLVQKALEEATVYVEAESAEEAEQMAVAQAESGNIEWRYLEALTNFDGELEVVTIDAVPS